MSDTTDDPGIAQRLERLERSERRWRRLAACGVLGVAAVALMGQKPASRVVEAERFVLRDAAGHARAELMVEGEQSVALRFKDADSMPRLTLGVENGAALVVLNERGGRLRAGLVALPHGAPGLTFASFATFATEKPSRPCSAIRSSETRTSSARRSPWWYFPPMAWITSPIEICKSPLT